MTELTEELKKQYQNYSQEELNINLIEACKNGYLEIIKYVLTSPDLEKNADIHVMDNYGFRCVCNNGHLNVIKYLLTSPDLKEHANIHAMYDLGFRWACENGDLEVVKYLLTSPDLKEHANIHAYYDYGFKIACKNRDLKLVKYLLTLNNAQCIHFQKMDYNLAWAIENKYDDLVLIMMKNLKNNHLFEYIECLPKIEPYSQELYEQVKNIVIEECEVNPQETSLFV